jgi:hypothetical protein
MWLGSFNRTTLRPTVLVVSSTSHHGPWCTFSATVLTRQFCGESSGGGGAAGIGSSSYWYACGTGSPRYSGMKTEVLDEQVLALVFHSIN